MSTYDVTLLPTVAMGEKLVPLSDRSILKPVSLLELSSQETVSSLPKIDDAIARNKVMVFRSEDRLPNEERIALFIGKNLKMEIRDSS